VYKYPDRFVAATACLPLNDIDAAIDELDRCIKQLKFCGIQITSTIQDKPLDSPEFEPLWERMCHYDLPIQIHPRTMAQGVRAFEAADAPSGPVDRMSQSAYNWPFETTLCMGRLVFSGIMEKYPKLKFLTHHMGGVTPYHIKRVTFFTQTAQMRFGVDTLPDVNFTKPFEDYYKMFYADTAVYGYVPTLMSGYDFFGAEHILFGTDIPYDSMGGGRLIPETIRSVQEMPISDAEKKMIFEDNARRLFRLPI
jgi:Predicted metal-dependent hydrolase of the TIM-barrel fold